MTLAEFLRDKTLPVKVRCKHWHKSEYFECMYKHNHKFYGHGETGRCDSWPCDTIADWELYEEPKKKVTKYLWAHRENGQAWSQSSNFYSNESDFKMHQIYSSSFIELVRLDWSATEFEE